MKIKTIKTLLSFLAVFCSMTVIAQTYYIPGNSGRGSGSGSSWDNARAGTNLTTDLGNGMIAGNKTMYLAAGDYTIDALVDISGRNVTIQGGFPANATGTSLAGYNPVANRTILKPGGITPALSRLWGVALFGSSNAVTLKGFEATGFSVAAGAFLYYDGGDMAIACSVKLEELYLHHNNSVASGGAVHLVGFINGGTSNTIHVNKCHFESNSTSAEGGGLILITVHASDRILGGTRGGSNHPFVIENSSFTNNQGGGHGGGVYLLGSADVLVRNNSFCGNEAAFGGGLAMLDMNRTTVTNNVFKGNRSNTTIPEWRSGAIINNSANAVFAGSLISSNTFYSNTPVDFAFSINNNTAVNNNRFSVSNFSQTYATNPLAGINWPPASNSGNTFNVSDPLPGGCPTYSGLLFDPNGDTDGDGIKNGDEGGPNTDTDGDGIPDYTDKDSDNDGIPDSVEKGSGTTPVDTDGDTIPDYRDLDSDNDGINDVREGGGTATDTNGDGRADGTPDPSTGIPSSAGANGTTPRDTDGDGRPDYKDLDSDNDGKSDLQENGNPAAVAGDTNNDGVIDYTAANDPDKDGVMSPADGLPATWGDGSDAAPRNTGPNTTDAPDYINLKSDGTANDIDSTPYKSQDANGDGKIDNSADPDGDGVPNVIDTKPSEFGGIALGADLRLLLNMADNNFTEGSLSKSLGIRVFNTISGSSSDATKPIIISIVKTPDFSVSLSGTAGEEWELVNLDPFTVVITSKQGVKVTNGTFKEITTTVTAAPSSSNGTANLELNIEDGSGGEFNNTNNSITRKLIVNL